MYRSIRDDLGLFMYLDLLMLSCILSYLYHDLAKSADDAYWIPVVLVLILCFCTFLVQIRVLAVAVDHWSCCIDYPEIRWALGVRVTYFLISLGIQSFVIKTNVVEYSKWLSCISIRCSCLALLSGGSILYWLFYLSRTCFLVYKCVVYFCLWLGIFHQVNSLCVASSYDLIYLLAG